MFVCILNPYDVMSMDGLIHSDHDVVISGGVILSVIIILIFIIIRYTKK